MVVLLVAIALGAVIIDQLTKYLAFRLESSVVVISNVLGFVKAENEGVAFGIGKDLRFGGIIWAVLSILTVAVLTYFYLKHTKRRLCETISFALIMGGAIGNLIDRIAIGGKVRDFIQLLFVRWPAFNLADSFIVIGVLLMVVSIAIDHEDTALNPAA